MNQFDSRSGLTCAVTPMIVIDSLLMPTLIRVCGVGIHDAESKAGRKPDLIS